MAVVVPTSKEIPAAGSGFPTSVSEQPPFVSPAEIWYQTLTILNVTAESSDSLEVPANLVVTAIGFPGVVTAFGTAGLGFKLDTGDGTFRKLFDDAAAPSPRYIAPTASAMITLSAALKALLAGPIALKLCSLVKTSGADANVSADVSLVVYLQKAFIQGSV